MYEFPGQTNLPSVTSLLEIRQNHQSIESINDVLIHKFLEWGNDLLVNAVQFLFMTFKYWQFLPSDKVQQKQQMPSVGKTVGLSSEHLAEGGHAVTPGQNSQETDITNVVQKLCKT